MVLKIPQFKKGIFLFWILLSTSAFSQVVIKSQSFDSGSSGYADDLGYAVSDATYGYVDSSTAESSPNSFHFTGGDDTQTDLDFSNVGLSLYSSVTVSISFASYNVRNGEDLEIALSYDNGVSYTYIDKLIDGKNMPGGVGQTINWGNTDPDNADASTNSYSIAISDTETQVKIRITSKELDTGDFFYIDNILIEGTVVSFEPIIDVVGNNTSLTDGQTVISTGDDTDFGQVQEVLELVTHVFTIENNGTTELNTISVNFIGDSEFLLDTSSTGTEVAVGASTTFSITFDPSAVATFTGVISITSNDTDRSPYTFTIGGEGVKRQIDFDGSNDYVDFGDNYDLPGDFTIEAWVLQENNSGTRTILSKGDLDSSNSSKEYGYVLTVEGGFPRFRTFNSGGSSRIDVSSSDVLTLNKWYHIAVSYNGSTTKLYIDGLEVGNDASGSSLLGDAESCYIGAYYDSDSGQVNYFNGRIDEVRIWDIALSEIQIREMMNQEIQNVSDNVQGKEIPLDISGSLTWDRLIGYYDMNNDDATDSSDSGIDGVSVNITSSQVQSAPLPYTTTRDGDWDDVTATTPWLYGDTVWNKPDGLGVDGSTRIEWNTVRIGNNIETSETHTSLGLIVDAGTEFSIKSSNGLFNTWYLEIDGVIDLEDESQLIQTENSYLAESSSGNIERDQQGSANSYTFNYWCSPVSAINSSENNKSFYIQDVLFDGSIPDDLTRDINFGSSVYYADGALSDPLKISSYWFYRFIKSENSVFNWQPVSGVEISTTEGFSMKGASGLSSIADEQNYVFVGKPNNAPISLGGLGGDLVHCTFDGVFTSSGKPFYTLTGNPFPSALDADQFILDNTSSGTDAITGTLYYWEHWGGGTHNLKDYQGGYATYTIAGGTSAPSHPDINQTGVGSKTPGQFVPVGQGFFVIQEHNDDGAGNLSNPSSGSVVLKNSQRVFEVENSNTESVFFKPSLKSKEVEANTKKRVWLGFESSSGFHRQLLTAFVEGATDEIDRGYDGLAPDFLKTDAFFIQEDKQFSIQAFGVFTMNREVPITVIVDESASGKTQRFMIDRVDGFSEQTKFYIKDKHANNTTYDISTNPFEVRLDAGEFKDRFSLVFQSADANRTAKGTSNIGVYLNADQSILNIQKKDQTQITQVTMFNSLGQFVKVWNSGLDNSQIEIPNKMTPGVYFLRLTTSYGTISKKIFIR